MKRQVFRCVVAVVTGIGLSMVGGCASAPETSDAGFEEAARAIMANWERTSVNPDVESWIEMWDDDAVKMATGKPTVYGKDNIRAYREGVDQKVAFDRFEITIEQAQPAGDFGWLQGRYHIVAVPRAGGPNQVSTGTYLTIFKRQPDGSWKIYRDTMMADPS